LGAFISWLLDGVDGELLGVGPVEGGDHRVGLRPRGVGVEQEGFPGVALVLAVADLGEQPDLASGGVVDQVADLLASRVVVELRGCGFAGHFRGSFFGSALRGAG
jgi:hypothetical protein